jgi:hypothetical protein
MGTKVIIAATKIIIAPSAVGAPAGSSWGPGLAIVVTFLLMVGCVVGVGAGWWYLGERRRTKRCLQEGARCPRPEAPTTVSSASASPGVELPVTRPRSPRHRSASRRTAHGRRGAQHDVSCAG